MSETLIKVERLRDLKEQVESFWPEYDDLSENPKCDKLGAAFDADSRFTSFKVEVSFDSWKGYYGSSSCSSIGRFDSETIRNYFVRALNIKKREIFEEMARMIGDDLASQIQVVEKHISKLQNFVDEYKPKEKE